MARQKYLVFGLFIIAFFFSHNGNAYELRGAPSNSNSQTLNLMKPSFSVKVPLATGGPQDISIENNALKAGSNWKEDEINILSKVSDDGVRIYVVQFGDNLSKIADSFEISINTIKWENNIGNTIKPGQELRILPETGIMHKVKKGDTLSKIANEYEVEVDSLKDTTGGVLSIGEKIFIKGGKKRTEVKTTKAVGTSSAKSSRNYTSSQKAAKGYYLFPTNGRITSRWGPRGGRFHYGVDIGAPRGTAIVASASGTVVKTVTACREGSRSCGGGYGNYVVIKHNNGTKTLYAHMQKVSVSYGSKVKQGQKIGTIGNTGRSSGPHTHFEIENIRTGKKIKPSF